VLRAHTFNELRYYLQVTPCPRCGKGPLQPATDVAPGRAGRVMSIPTSCRACGERAALDIVYEHDSPSDEIGVEMINPTDEPSRIVDLAQWLSLFHMLVERAWGEQDKPQVRRLGFRAALCLAEALKFYGDNELPDESAFFTPESKAAFHEHPEKFARQRLRDILTRLPALPQMARRVAKDETRVKRRRWKFWKRSG